MSRRTNWRVYIAALVVADAAALALAFASAALIRGAADPILGDAQLDALRYGLVGVLVVPVCLLLFAARGAYSIRKLLGGLDEYVAVAGGSTIGVLIVVASSYAYGSVPLVSRTWLLIFWFAAILLTVSGRFALRRAAYRMRRRGSFIRRVLIAGANDQANAIARQLHGVGRGFAVVGFLDDYAPRGTEVRLADEPGEAFVILGHPRDIQAITRSLHVDVVVVVPEALSWESQQNLLGFAVGPERPDVWLAPTHYDFTTAGVEVAPLAFVPMLRIETSRITGSDAVLRALVDIACAAVLGLALITPMGLAILAARLRGIRPLFTTRAVYAEGGKVVRLRLLSPDVSEDLLLRGLPALLNVLRGELALVGPRPARLEEQGYHRRFEQLLTVKPGLTGPWRLLNSSATPEETALADALWVRNWTIWQHLFTGYQSLRKMLRARARDGSVARWERRVEAAEGAAVGLSD